ncbi:MAG: DUF309 domain-containing protein [Aquisalimonadaceae bacterium]
MGSGAYRGVQVADGPLNAAGVRPRRFTGRAFPPYRHLPGATPHPLTDPAGHGGVLASAPDSPEQLRVCFLLGCDLYNHGYWWEAHEAWEAVWHAVNRTGTRGALLQALIQAGNAHLKLRMKRGNAVARLRSAVMEHIARIRSTPDTVCLGIDVIAWSEQFDAYIETRLSRAALCHDVTGFPYLEPDVTDSELFQDRRV